SAGGRSSRKSKGRGNIRFGLSPVKALQHWHKRRRSRIPTQTPAAAQMSAPLADDAMSVISSCGVSQKSKVSNSGPARYQHNQIKKRTRRNLPLIAAHLISSKT